MEASFWSKTKECIVLLSLNSDTFRKKLQINNVIIFFILTFLSIIIKLSLSWININFNEIANFHSWFLFVLDYSLVFEKNEFFTIYFKIKRKNKTVFDSVMIIFSEINIAKTLQELSQTPIPKPYTNQKNVCHHLSTNILKKKFWNFFANEFPPYIFYVLGDMIITS